MDNNNVNANGISLKKLKLNHNNNNINSNRSNNMNYNIAVPSYRSHNNSGTISPLSPRNVKFATELQNLPKIEYVNNKHNTKYAFDNVNNNSLSLRKTNSFMNVFEHNKILKQQKSFSPTAMHSKYELLSPKITRYTFIPKEELYSHASNNINSLMISNLKYNNSTNIHKAKSIYNNSSHNKFLINYNS